MTLDGCYTAVAQSRTSKKSDVRCTNNVYIRAETVWSFYRFLHFIATEEGLNSLSERS